MRRGRYTGILTWAPDRLSRNAGDLGSLVDLMDQKLLHEIRTYGQHFSNNPNEKFLLMILCSQAKLENDNKSINKEHSSQEKCNEDEDEEHSFDYTRLTDIMKNYLLSKKSLPLRTYLY